MVGACKQRDGTIGNKNMYSQRERRSRVEIKGLGLYLLSWWSPGIDSYANYCREGGGLVYRKKGTLYIGTLQMKGR